MNKQEAGRRIAEKLHWARINNIQSRMEEEVAAAKRWEHQEVAQKLNIPVIYKPLNGSPIKIFPLAEAQQTQTINKLFP